jgi:2-polyprenyl-6-hydroxyphenyl methylase/3-demethylubiquinone-9 3-methyltransferase
MRRPEYSEDWPATWKYSHPYDLLELHGATHHPGYSCAWSERKRQILDLVTRAVAPPARVLDVAAAQGNFTLTLAEQGYEVTWNDIRADLAGYVRLKHEYGKVHFAPGNVFDLQFAVPFDLVLIAEVVEHMAHPDQLLQRCAHLVRPGGHVVMTTPNGAYLRNRLPRFSDCTDPSRFESQQFQPDADGHIFLLYPNELPVLAAAAGLVLRECQVFSNPLTAGALRTGFLLRWLPRHAVDYGERLTRRLPWRIRERCCTAMAAWFQRPQTAVPR